MFSEDGTRPPRQHPLLAWWSRRLNRASTACCGNRLRRVARYYLLLWELRVPRIQRQAWSWPRRTSRAGRMCLCDSCWSRHWASLLLSRTTCEWQLSESTGGVPPAGWMISYFWRSEQELLLGSSRTGSSSKVPMGPLERLAICTSLTRQRNLRDLENRVPWRALSEAMVFGGSGRAHVLTMQAHRTPRLP